MYSRPIEPGHSGYTGLPLCSGRRRLPGREDVQGVVTETEYAFKLGLKTVGHIVASYGIQAVVALVFTRDDSPQDVDEDVYLVLGVVAAEADAYQAWYATLVTGL